MPEGGPDGRQPRRPEARRAAPIAPGALYCRFMRWLTWFATACALAAAPPPAVHNVRDYGARGDGRSKDTAAIQKAIDAAARQGGGVVLLPPGTYLSGTLHLRSRVALEIAAGATLAASPEAADFDQYEELPFKPVDDHETTYFRHALLAGEDLEDVALYGAGVVDGNRSKRGGPKPIALKRCRRVSLRGLTIRNSPNYAVSLLGCEDVELEGLRILNSYCDGIDPDCSRFVRIANCYVDSWDDAIVLKASQALGEPRPTEHVTVTNCVLRTSCNHFKLGTESRGDFRNIALSNCVMLNRDAGRPAISAIALESVDGARIERVAISNVLIQEARTPLFLRLGNRGRGMDPPVPGALEDVSISNLSAAGGVLASSITGLPGHPVRNVSLSDIRIAVAGGGKFSGAEVPEHPAKYPEATMFGELPAHTLYARHVEGLILRNLKTGWSRPDERPALLLEDVRRFEIHGFHAESAAGSLPLIWLRDSAGGLLSGMRLSAPLALLLRVSGRASGDISLVGNDLRQARRLVELDGGADPFAVASIANLTAGKIPPID